MMFVAIYCRKHPTYEAYRKPKTCEICLDVYKLLHETGTTDLIIERTSNEDDWGL